MPYSLFPEAETKNVFPSTRYQGSKAKFLDWIEYLLEGVEFETVLDAFGGTGCVSYLFKDLGKKVTYNDVLPFNSIIGKALIENSSERLNDNDIEYILTKHENYNYPDFIERTFQDIYFTDEENRWLDFVSFNIRQIENEYKRALAWFALFQACIIKRPYNLFHRKNLYVRLNDVTRSFGNKRTWDTPFAEHFIKFANEANLAIFDNGEKCCSLNNDAITIHEHYDLVYIDTPYLNDKGQGIDYADFYHFLNGVVDYDNWANRIDYSSKHKRLKRQYSVWNDKENIIHGFEQLIETFDRSILVISYRSNGIPSIDCLIELLERRGRRNQVHLSKDIKYVLSDKQSNEVLIVSFPRNNFDNLLIQ